MLFERIESRGLAHYSYLVGDGGSAFVIDPRRDCEDYVRRAAREGTSIRYILETHRHEDYLTGSPELAARTGAEIWHADAQLPYGYGRPVDDGQIWRIGGLRLEALHTPGHTPGSMSYLLHDAEGRPWVAFTGDTLFAGDVGRVDLVDPERKEEMAGLLFDSLFHRLLPLGDGVIVCPAHGAGSICGGSISERTWTTIGLERERNSKLQFPDRDAFIGGVARELERPPYLRAMETGNLLGPRILGRMPLVRPLTADEFAREAANAVVLDTRRDLGYAAAHVPQSLSIWEDRLPSFGGWFLPYDRPLLLVNETEDPTEIVRLLIRLGYDNLVGYLAGGMLSWHTSGRASHAIELINVQSLCAKIDGGDEPWILDIRSDAELAQSGGIPGAQHVHITQLPQHYDEIPKDRRIHLFCGSGTRAMIAGSLLQREGWQNLAVVLGGLSGWTSTTCALDTRT